MLLVDYAFWLYMSPGTALNLASGTFEHRLAWSSVGLQGSKDINTV